MSVMEIYFWRKQIRQRNDLSANPGPIETTVACKFRGRVGSFDNQST